MSDETAPQDAKAMSPASAGSVASDIVGRLVAWRDERGFPTPGEMMDEAAAEIARLRITDAEREALRKVLRLLREGFFRDSSIELVQAASVIDGLLDRQG